MKNQKNLTISNCVIRNCDYSSLPTGVEVRLIFIKKKNKEDVNIKSNEIRDIESTKRLYPIRIDDKSNNKS